MLCVKGESGENLWMWLGTDSHSLGAAWLIGEHWVSTCRCVTPHQMWTPRQPPQSFAASLPLLPWQSSPWACLRVSVASLTYIIDKMKTINVVPWGLIFSLSKAENLYLFLVNLYIHASPSCFLDAIYLVEKKKSNYFVKNLKLT